MINDKKKIVSVVKVENGNTIKFSINYYLLKKICNMQKMTEIPIFKIIFYVAKNIFLETSTKSFIMVPDIT